MGVWFYIVRDVGEYKQNKYHIKINETKYLNI
jgi:hypothetical protein